jgi:MFS family permease
MSTFTAAAIIPAYGAISEDFNCTIQAASYLTSLQIAILGGAPLFWKPLSNRFGRRPIFLISLLCSAVCNIGCAVAPGYGSTAACRALVAFFISPAAAIGSAVVTESFFRNERAKYMGIWTIMVTCGVPLGGFIMGFVAQYLSFRWIYWLIAIINGVQFVLYVFFGPETRYLRKGVEHTGSSLKQEYLNFGRIDPTPIKFLDFIQPLKFFAYASVAIPALAYAVVFLLTGVLITVELPQLFGEKFHFGPQPLGLQFLAFLIGSLIGEFIGGRMSDLWMTRKTKASKTDTRPPPEYRLWLSYPAYVFSIVGLVVFLVQIDRLESYNVTPMVGVAIAAAGNQIVTTVLITYAVDTHPDEAASIGVFITFVRQILGFIGPFCKSKSYPKQLEPY